MSKELYWNLARFLFFLVPLSWNAFCQLRADTCVAKMNDINSDLSVLARKLEDLLEKPWLEHLERGKADLLAGKLGEATAHFDVAIEQGPTCYEAYAYRGLALQRNAELRLADEAFRRCQEAFSQNRLNYKEKVQPALDEALDQLVEIRKRLDDLSANSLLIDGVGNSYNTKDKLLKVEQLEGHIRFVKMQNERKDLPGQLLLLIGNFHFTTQNWSDAEAFYRRGINSGETLPQCHGNLAALLFLTDRKEEAISHYRQAVSGQAPLSQRFVSDIEAYLANRGRTP